LVNFFDDEAVITPACWKPTWVAWLPMTSSTPMVAKSPSSCWLGPQTNSSEPSELSRIA
jgi:hypothetical protein